MSYDFDRYVQFKRGQHERVLKRAKRDRNRPAEHAYHLQQAAAVREVLADDMRRERSR